MKKQQRGFTLMELLIVIGVLGILAAGLLAAIDPFEQLKKARDTNNRSATLSLVSAFTSFYANHGAFPWNLTTPDDACNRGADEDLEGLGALSSGAMNVQDDEMRACLDASVILDGELKDTFMTGIGSTNIYVASDPSDLTNVVVCYAPEGKSARSDASTKYNVTQVGNTNLYTILDTHLADDATKCPDVTKSSCVQCFK